MGLVQGCPIGDYLHRLPLASPRTWSRVTTQGYGRARERTGKIALVCLLFANGTSVADIGRGW